MARLSIMLLALVITFIAAELVISPDTCAAGAEKPPDKVITAEKPSKAKIWFGVGMLVAGILAVKYL